MSAIDLEISALIQQWQTHAQEAIDVGLRMAKRLVELERERDQLRLDNAAQVQELIRLRGERAEWQETAEAYCDRAGQRFKLLERINASCGRALAGDHDKASMLATLKLCAELAASEKKTISNPPAVLQ